MKYEFDDAVLDVLVATQQAGKKHNGQDPNGQQIMTILTKAIAINAITMDYNFNDFLSELIQAFVFNKENYNSFLDEARKNDKA